MWDLIVFYLIVAFFFVLILVFFSYFHDWDEICGSLVFSACFVSYGLNLSAGNKQSVTLWKTLYSKYSF